MVGVWCFIDVQLQYGSCWKRDFSILYSHDRSSLFAKCVWGYDVVSVIVDRPDHHTDVVEGHCIGYLN